MLGLHRKPTALLDLGGFYAPLVEHLRVMADTDYLGRAQFDALGVVTDAGEFLEFVRTYRHPERKWLPVGEGVSDPVGR